MRRSVSVVTPLSPWAPTQGMKVRIDHEFHGFKNLEIVAKPFFLRSMVRTIPPSPASDQKIREICGFSLFCRRELVPCVGALPPPVSLLGGRSSAKPPLRSRQRRPTQKANPLHPQTPNIKLQLYPLPHVTPRIDHSPNPKPDPLARGRTEHRLPS